MLSPLPGGVTPSRLLAWLCQVTGQEGSAFGAFQIGHGMARVAVAPGQAGRIAGKLEGALMEGVRLSCQVERPPEGDRQQWLERWRALLRLEARAEEERLAQEGAQNKGKKALTGLVVQGEEPGIAGRWRWILAKPKQAPLPYGGPRIDAGKPMLLVPDPPPHDGRGARGVPCVAVRRDSRSVTVLIDSPPEETEGTWRLIARPDAVTRERMEAALMRASGARDGRIGKLVDILLGKEPPRVGAGNPNDLEWFHSGLNASQKEAVSRALVAPDLFLIHGPPGTGKTTTLVELVRQAVKKGQQVLVTAPSNLAVDHLALGLFRCGLEVVRLGHPARVMEELLPATLEYRLEKHPDWRESKKLAREARSLRDKAERWTKAKPEPGEKQQSREESRKLLQDARALERQALRAILRDCPIVAATATGLEPEIVEDRRFDLVVLDEAAQATEPAAWVAITLGDRVVLAGDPKQLPPTVLSDEAAEGGLAVSLLERLMGQLGPDHQALLGVQYRMDPAISLFPNLESYAGKLADADAVVLRPVPPWRVDASEVWQCTAVRLIDTAGSGWEDEEEEDGASRLNPGEAKRVVAEARKLLEAGLDPSELGLITPYAGQARLLRQLLEDERVEIDSVDGFQGREKDVILLSLVRSNASGEIGFLKEKRRTHVAITRARRLLLLVGDSATLAADGYFEQLFGHHQEAGQARSVYELPDHEG